MKERLHKFIATHTSFSRRKAETLISGGRVFVNEKKVTELGTSIDPNVDAVWVNGQHIVPVQTWRYIALNKPAGYVCTRATHAKEKTVYDLVPKSRDLVICGRLDKDSEGLVILTNDGELTNKLTHPRYQHQKEYVVRTMRELDPPALAILGRGIKLAEGTARFDSLKEIAPQQYRIVLHQGWKRQIRRMIAAVKHDVARLTRTRIGKLHIGDLETGKWKEIQRKDIV